MDSQNRSCTGSYFLINIVLDRFAMCSWQRVAKYRRCAGVGDRIHGECDVRRVGTIIFRSGTRYPEQEAPDGLQLFRLKRLPRAARRHTIEIAFEFGDGFPFEDIRRGNPGINRHIFFITVRSG